MDSVGNYVAHPAAWITSMAYGVDQCRRCGRAMPSAGPEAAARYDLTKMQKPSMPEAKWRAQGWKAAPTIYQLTHTLDGLCADCKFKAAIRIPHKNRPVMMGIGMMALLVILVYLLH